MALDVNNLFGNASESDGSFSRKNIQINREDTQPILQNIGDMVLWERGNGYLYDNYNSSIDATKWTNTSGGSGGSVGFSESTTYLRGTITATAGTYTLNRNLQIKTIDLPVIGDITEIEFSTTAYSGACDWGGAGAKVYIFGINVYTLTTHNVYGNPTTATFKGIKNTDGTWNFYVNDILTLSNQNATSNELIIQADVYYHGVWDGSETWYNQFNEIYVGGQTYLLIKSTQRTFAINLASF